MSGTGRKPSDHRYSRQKDAFFRKQIWQVKPLPGLVDFLDELRERHVPLAIATSGSARRTHFTLEQLNLRRYFREIVTANEVEASKPNPAIYRLACEPLSISPSRSLAFEDAFSGVLAAKGAGLRCVGVAPDDDDHRLLAAGADLVLADFRKLTLDGLMASMNRSQKRSA